MKFNRGDLVVCIDALSKAHVDITQSSMDITQSSIYIVQNCPYSDEFITVKDDKGDETPYYKWRFRRVSGGKLSAFQKALWGL